MSVAALIGGLAAIFAGLTLASWVGLRAAAARRQVGRSLAALTTQRPGLVSGAGDPVTPLSERVLLPLVDRAARVAAAFAPSASVQRIARRLDEAGNPPGWDTDRVLAFKVVGAGALASVGLVAAALAGERQLTVVGVLLAGTVGGFLVPNGVLHQVVATRRERIAASLPDSLDLLTINVEAGLSFDAALSQVARNTEGPLADEIFRVLQEMQIGMGRAAALKALAERSEVPELRSFVLALVQADELGIPVARVLRVQAGQMRSRRTLAFEEKAARIPVKILFPVVICILPTLFIVVVGPALVNILDSFAG